VLLLDVDNFKEVVRTYGYDDSRALLRDIASTLRGRLRPVDSAGRFGFDEFILLLENMDLTAAREFALECAREISRSAYTPRSIHSTVSIGVAAYPVNGATCDDLLRTAKTALFEAQRGGRNGVFAFAEGGASGSTRA
jgi:diguanylate cyclase (GGDEF)-like protein